MSAVFTLEIDAKPIVAFEAKNAHEAMQLRGERWFRDDLAQLKSGGTPLWDGKGALKTRYASSTERAAFREAAGEDQSDEMVLVYLVELDVPTSKTALPTHLQQTESENR